MSVGAAINDNVLVEKRKHILLVTLNRPNHGNALTMSMYQTLSGALQSATADDEIRAVVVTGNGKFFTTGADVQEAAEKAMEGDGPEQIAASLRKYPISLTQAFIEFPKFLIAAVNGPVVGYPAGQLGLYDLVFVAESATLQLPFMQLGLVPEAGSSFTLQRVMGHPLACDLLFTGRTLSATEMVQCGVASRVLPDAGFLGAVLAIVATAAAENSPRSLMHAKRLMRAPLRRTLDEVNKGEADALVAMFESGEPAKRFAKKFMAMREKKSKL